MTAAVHAAISATCTTGALAWVEAASTMLALVCLLLAGAILLRAWGTGRLPADIWAMAAAVALIGCVWLASHGGLIRQGFYAEALAAGLFALVVLALILRRILGLSCVETGAAVSAVVLVNAVASLAMQRRGLSGPVFAALPLAMLYCLAATLVLKARLGMHGDRRLRGLAAAQSDNRHFPQLKMGYALIQAGLVFAIGLVAQAYGAALCAGSGAWLHLLWHGLTLVSITTIAFACLKYAPAARRSMAPDAACPLPGLS